MGEEGRVNKNKQKETKQNRAEKRTSANPLQHHNTTPILTLSNLAVSALICFGFSIFEDPDDVPVLILLLLLLLVVLLVALLVALLVPLLLLLLPLLLCVLLLLMLLVFLFCKCVFFCGKSVFFFFFFVVVVVGVFLFFFLASSLRTRIKCFGAFTGRAFNVIPPELCEQLRNKEQR